MLREAGAVRLLMVEVSIICMSSAVLPALCLELLLAWPLAPKPSKTSSSRAEAFDRHEPQVSSSSKQWPLRDPFARDARNSLCSLDLL